MVKCSECGKDMKRVRVSKEKGNEREIEFKELEFVPYEIYKNPELLESNYIFICVECRYIKRLSFKERIRLSIAEKVLGDKI